MGEGRGGPLGGVGCRSRGTVGSRAYGGGRLRRWWGWWGRWRWWGDRELVTVVPRVGLLMVDVDLEAEAELATVRVGAANSTPRLVTTLATACGIARASECVQPLQQ